MSSLRNQLADSIKYFRNNFGMNLVRAVEYYEISSNSEYSLGTMVSIAKANQIAPDNLIIRANGYTDYDNFNVYEVVVGKYELQSDESYFEDVIAQLFLSAGIDSEYSLYLSLKSKFESA